MPPSAASNFAWPLLAKGVIAGIGKRRCTEALQALSPGSRLARPCLPIAIIATCTYLLKGRLLYAATQVVLKCGLVWPVACDTA